MSSRVWGLVAWVAVAALPLHNLLSCLRLPRSCDTTYLWEGYEEVALRQPHPRYKLIKFADRDRELEPGAWLFLRIHVACYTAEICDADKRGKRIASLHPQPTGLRCPAAAAAGPRPPPPPQHFSGCSSGMLCQCCLFTATWVRTSRCGRQHQRRGESWHAALHPTPAGRCGCSGTAPTLPPRHRR
jgi:hypothetical protein